LKAAVAVGGTHVELGGVEELLRRRVRANCEAYLEDNRGVVYTVMLSRWICWNSLSPGRKKRKLVKTRLSRGVGCGDW